MNNYKNIPIWKFPCIETYIGLNDIFRKKLFNKAILFLGSEQKVVDFLNKSIKKYSAIRICSRLNLYSWKKGYITKNGKIKRINVPLWVLHELSIVLSNCMNTEIQQNIEYYSAWGKSNRIKNPKLPLKLTPELVSVIFHFFGDGHIGKKGVASSYRQMNKKGLQNFLIKVKNCFGNFDFSKQEYEDGRLNVPKAITNFYEHYFKLPSTKCLESYIPKNIKSLSKEYLLAGLVSFIIDDGHIGEVITIYSKNKNLLKDIKEIALKCGYICNPIREKYVYGKFDVFRFSISSKSYKKLFNDVFLLSNKFPTCDFAHKQKILNEKVR